MAVIKRRKGDPDFIMRKRGSQMSRAGGAHSGPHTKRQTRFLRSMNKSLQAIWRAKYQGRVS